MLNLEAKSRQARSRRELKEDRATGRLPAVIYGSKEKPQPVFVDQKDFIRVFKEAGESSVINLMVDKTKREALIYMIDWHPLTGQPIHVDFYMVRQDELVTVSVPLKFIGTAPAEKELGGTLVKVLHELEVEALPKDLPHELEVDISGLTALDSQVTVADIAVPVGVEIKETPEEAIAMISGVVEESEGDEAGPDLASIEVEKKGKTEEADGSAEAADDN